jgi:hypothetical protein
MLVEPGFGSSGTAPVAAQAGMIKTIANSDATARCRRDDLFMEIPL